MYEVCRTYYDSPREDCSGYYQDIYEFPTAKEAWKAAERWNRSEEPKGAYADLRSGRPRRYVVGLIGYNGRKLQICNTTDYQTFQAKLKEARTDARSLKTTYYFDIA